MEDIPGATQGDQIAACGPDVAAAVLEEMAGLHAPCWEAPALERLEWLNRSTPESDAFLVAMVTSLLPGFLERYADTLAPEHQEVCRFFVAHLPEYLQLRSGPRTASHGDFRLDNLLFQEGTTRPVVVDWQTVGWAGASVDVAYFVGGCLDVDDRRTHEPELLAGYHEALCRRGVRDYSLEQLAPRCPARHLRRSAHGDRGLHGGAAHHARRPHVPDEYEPPRATRPRCGCARTAPGGVVTDLLVLCTGNAARSVMAGFMLDVLADDRPGDPLHVVTAGTHTIDGQPMGMRTRTALSRLPAWPTSTSGATGAVRCTVSTWSTPSWWSSWRPITCASCGGSSPMRLERPPPSAISARSCRPGHRPCPSGWRPSNSRRWSSTTPTTSSTRRGHEADVYAACVDELWVLCQSLVKVL